MHIHTCISIFFFFFKEKTKFPEIFIHNVIYVMHVLHVMKLVILDAYENIFLFHTKICMHKFFSPLFIPSFSIVLISLVKCRHRWETKRNMFNNSVMTLNDIQDTHKYIWWQFLYKYRHKSTKTLIHNVLHIYTHRKKESFTIFVS